MMVEKDILLITHNFHGCFICISKLYRLHIPQRFLLDSVG